MNEEIKQLKLELEQVARHEKFLESAIRLKVHNHIERVVNDINVRDGKTFIARRVDSYGYFNRESPAVSEVEARSWLVNRLWEDYEDFGLFGLDVLVRDGVVSINRYTYTIVESDPE